MIALHEPLLELEEVEELPQELGNIDGQDGQDGQDSDEGETDDNVASEGEVTDDDEMVYLVFVCLLTISIIQLPKRSYSINLTSNVIIG